MPQSKGEIALCELDRLRAEGVRFGVVLADAGYGCSAVFRHGLDARGLAWAVGLAKNQKVYDPRVRLVEPGGRANLCRIRSRGRPRRFWPRCPGGA